MRLGSFKVKAVLSRYTCNYIAEAHTTGLFGETYEVNHTWAFPKVFRAVYQVNIGVLTIKALQHERIRFPTQHQCTLTPGLASLKPFKQEKLPKFR